MSRLLEQSGSPALRQGNPLPSGILVDTSSSTLDQLLEGRPVAERISTLVDDLLNALAFQSMYDGEFVTRFEVALVGFSDKAYSLRPDLSREIRFIPGADFFPHPLEITETNGRTRGRFLDLPRRVQHTNETAAWESLVPALDDFASRHPNNQHQPRVICFTDGEYNDGGSPLQAIEALKARDVLIYFAMVRPGTSNPVCFPTSQAELPDAPSREHFEYASEIPLDEVTRAEAFGLKVNPGARAIVVDASLDILTRFLKWGTTMRKE